MLSSSRKSSVLADMTTFSNSSTVSQLCKSITESNKSLPRRKWHKKESKSDSSELSVSHYFHLVIQFIHISFLKIRNSKTYRMFHHKISIHLSCEFLQSINFNLFFIADVGITVMTVNGERSFTQNKA